MLNCITQAGNMLATSKVEKNQRKTKEQKSNQIENG